ncbi:uncharacterized protein CANTADRAFT_45322 [Suhomyces tanzawaensis NRRL Y-17324]|uniref:Transcription activator GCR1-like domain-containing protein n=1 Tax=Suhomyces tanzawaensis NRRL Y-17324 TaxID=984487 RepID=A0A1E4SRI5_9ASCO|nr:uncharacterized protein CANTADRAFT_45322 [Suhomyces tanzawaensis NRRL Y-17324]ODV82012.1 hypothetical protein CANTADRAFT_45322 [Suhomyces tanzawaensis NRRL Y-17324]
MDTLSTNEIAESKAPTDTGDHQDDQENNKPGISSETVPPPANHAFEQSTATNGENLERINESIEENDKIAALSQEVGYLRQIVDFQNNKIDKLTSLITEYFENKNEDAIIRSLQAIQDNVIEEDHVNEIDQGVPVHLDGNMDPALHQVAVVAAAVQAQENLQHSQEAAQQHRQHEKVHKKIYAATKRKLEEGEDGREDEDGRYEGRVDAKKPKITVDFLHNPMSVKEIYDEFTKGFRGQLPLRDMDAKYGKHEWRGDSRSKESKRFQRRKKLFDAVERGTLKYGKPAEEIIQYIEEFRGDKSLTWVMNGNLPQDLIN